MELTVLDPVTQKLERQADLVQICREYAEIEERGLPERVKICGQSQRITDIYTSRHHLIKVFISMRSVRHQPKFLLHFTGMN